MNFLRSVAMAFSMFSKIPVPEVEWKNANMQYMLAAFPLVGAVIGLLIWAWCAVCSKLNFGTVLFAAGLTLIPMFISGGIHMDGYCDTLDALASHAEPAKKREILKDPHTGAFALIGVCTYFIMYFAVCTEFSREQKLPLLLGMIPVMSRAVSGLTGILFPTSGSEGMLAAFHNSAKKFDAAFILSVFLIICIFAMLLISFWAGLAMALTALMCGVYVYFMSKKQFGGMSGDLSGFLLQITELTMLCVLLIIQKAVSI